MPIRREDRSSDQVSKLLEDILKVHKINDLEKALANFPGLSTFKESKQDSPINIEPTISDALDKFLTVSETDYKTFSNSTRKTYKTEAKLFLSYCKAKQERGENQLVSEVTTPGFLADYLERAKNVNTRNKKAAFLRSFIKDTCLEFLDKKRINQIFDKRGVLQIRSTENDLPKAFTRNQILHLLNECRQSQNAIRNFTIIITFLSSGIRLDELVNLKVGDVFFDQKRLRVRPKGDKNAYHMRFIMEVGLIRLKDYIDFTYGHMLKKLSVGEYKALYLFSNNGGQKPLTGRAIEIMVDQLVKKLKGQGVIEKDKKLGIHSFRHSFAIYALESGVDIYTISKLLGHKTITSTEVYLNMFDYQIQSAIEKHPLAKLSLF